MVDSISDMSVSSRQIEHTKCTEGKTGTRGTTVSSGSISIEISVGLYITASS